MGNGRLISLVRIYTDASDQLPYQVVAFTDLSKAEDFVRDIRNDDGLAGINRVELDYSVPTDDWAIEQFWADLNKEVGV